MNFEGMLFELIMYWFCFRGLTREHLLFFHWHIDYWCRGFVLLSLRNMLVSFRKKITPLIILPKKKK